MEMVDKYEQKKEGIRLQFQGFPMESAVILIEATCFFLLSFWECVKGYAPFPSWQNSTDLLNEVGLGEHFFFFFFFISS